MKDIYLRFGSHILILAGSTPNLNQHLTNNKKF